MERVQNAVLDTPVEGINLKIGTLRDQLGSKPSLLVFLRHFGCMFCRESVADLHRISQRYPVFPPVIFFYQGSVAQGQQFFERLWTDASYISDEPKYFYESFGLERGKASQIFGPPIWACGVRAALKGHLGGAVVGDAWQMPGIFLLQQDRILWKHYYRHAADHPKWRGILDYMPDYRGRNNEQSSSQRRSPAQ